MDDFDRGEKKKKKKKLFRNSFWSVLIKNDIKRMKGKKNIDENEKRTSRERKGQYIIITNEKKGGR
jgi:hypothetical protein